MRFRFSRVIAMFLVVCTVLWIASPNTQAEAAVASAQSGATSTYYEGNGFIINYAVTASWNNGYNASIKISNTSDATIENWSMKLSAADKITNVWNAVIAEKNKDNYVIKNAGWNQDIKAGETVEFGMSVSNAFSDFPECGMQFGKLVSSKDTYECRYAVTSDWKSGFNGEISVKNISDKAIDEWQLTFDLDNEISNIWDAQIVSHTGSTYVVKGLDYNQNIKAGATRKFGFTVNNGQAAKQAAGFRLSEYVDYADANLIPLSADEYFLDYDEDGVPNLYEYFFGLDMNNPDTDGDGVSDREAVKALSRDLLTADADEDGISNLAELQYGLNPFKKDTYDDGILDGDRMMTVTQSGKKSDLYDTEATVSLTISGKSLDSFKVEKISDKDMFLNSSIPGVISNGYELSVNEAFDEATLEFTIPEEIANDPEAEPVIYYWNRETQTLEEVPNQTISGNKVIAKLSHFSPYILINKKKWLESRLANKILNPAELNTLADKMNFVLSLDESGSISSSNYSIMKNSCKSLINGLSDNDKIAVYTFDDVVRKKCTFTSKSSALSIVSSLPQYNGCTAIKDALLAGINEHKTYSTNGEKRIIVLLTDGYTNYDRTTLSYDAIAQQAADNDIVIYTIGVGSSYDKSALSTVANKTGGQFYSVADFNKLLGVFDAVISDSDLYIDSDSDGISDYHEKMIAQGLFRTNSGSLLSGEHIMDYLNPDSDGDGLLDGEEIQIVEGDDGPTINILSSPVRVDSDYDGFADLLEDAFSFSALVSTNVTVTSDAPALAAATVGGVDMPGIWIGTWQEMARNHSWNYIHNEVVGHIIAANPGYAAEVAIPGVGRADIVDFSRFMVWEVKPVSYAAAEKALKALGQLDGYVEGLTLKENNFFTRGMLFGRENTAVFPSSDGEYEIIYANMGNGLVIYSFKRTSRRPNESEEPATNPATNPAVNPAVNPNEDEDEDPATNPGLNPGLNPGYSMLSEDEIQDILWSNFRIDRDELGTIGCFALAILLIVGGVAIGVGTEGAGIPATVVCCIVAFYLIYGYAPRNMEEAESVYVYA